jgi:hypothetical protein
MSEIVSRTVINQNQVRTPLLVANDAQINNISLDNVTSLNAKNGYIENLTIKELTVLDEVEGNGDSSETYETAIFNQVNLNFGDDYNCKYILADHNTLTSEDGGLMLNINAEVPSELGAKLVCRYLVVDLRELSEDTVVGVTWPEFPIRWLYGVPDIEAGYFYVLAFQRFTKDLIIGNVAVKIEG